MKAQLFGTDGIRGIANQYPITPEVALRIGRAVARVARSQWPEKPPIETIPKIHTAVKNAERAFVNKGRVLVRYSGTERKIRVLRCQPCPNPSRSHLNDFTVF